MMAFSPLSSRQGGTAARRRPSRSSRASAGYPSSAARAINVSGNDAPSRKENADEACSSMNTGFDQVWKRFSPECLRETTGSSRDRDRSGTRHPAARRPTRLYSICVGAPPPTPVAPRLPPPKPRRGSCGIRAFPLSRQRCATSHQTISMARAVEDPTAGEDCGVPPVTRAGRPCSIATRAGYGSRKRRRTPVGPTKVGRGGNTRVFLRPSGRA